MKILLTGRDGQVGWELQDALAPLGHVVATGRNELDLADPDAIRRVVREARPQVIVNAAAYTAVDKAEKEPDAAFAVNAIAPAVLAEEARRSGALVVHYSTDYVFGGDKKTPYVEEDSPRPLNTYGRTKLAGESAVQEAGCRHVILRTSWVYSLRGRNFLLAILGKARKGELLRVVDDQVGAPTRAADIAHRTARLLSLPSIPEGVLNLSAAGQTSWHGFAAESLRVFGIDAPLLPISSAEYPAAAKRPGYSVLDSSAWERRSGLERIPDWRVGLAAQRSCAP